jgi:tryptophan synthase alpha subunit
MKKILFILSFILLGVTSGYSQLNVTHQTEKESEEIGTIRMMSIYLKHSESLGYFFTMTTDNRFDGVMLFLLGEDAESAIETVNDMISLIDNHIASTEVKQGNTTTTLSNREKGMGKNYLYLRQQGYAGTNAISKKELEKIIKKIKEHAKITD